MSSKNESKVQKPEIKTGIAQIKKTTLYRQGKKLTKDHIITFRSHKWEDFSVYVNGTETAKTENNPEGKSRMEQLGIGDLYTEKDYVEVSIAQIIVGKTGYEKDGELVPHKSTKGRANRFEIISLIDASEDDFNQAFDDFISTEYEKGISEKIKDGWTFLDSIEFFKRKHRDSRISILDK
ncbi:MAG: hypothetical protein ACJAWV_001550 [Flammeovirgaceae bacterium]|jgi:hypothetical protein